jgi:hypothetical protein
VKCLTPNPTVLRLHRMLVEGTAGPSASPDFLLVLVALASSMRLSLMKAAHAALSGVARQEIRVCSG